MSSNINVLQAIPKLGYGGAETGCYDIAHYLPENNCKSFIVTSGGELTKFIDKKKVKLIRLPVPELNEERRTELKKLIKSIGEKCKVSIRNIRREANEDLKKLLKSKEIGEDEEKSFEKNVQNITDKHIAIVDEKVSSKEKEIMTI